MKLKRILNELRNFKFKGTVILVLIFAVLLVFVLVFEKKRPTKTEEELSGLIETFTVWEFNKEDVKKIEISFKDKNFEMEREGERWLAKKPKEFEVKKESVDDLLENFAKLQGEKKIKEPANLSDFELDKPRLKALFTLKDDKKYELFLGAENPEGTKVYGMRTDENYVFLLEQSLKSDLELKEEEIQKKEEKK